MVVHEWLSLSVSFFFNDTATTEIYTLSLHDALPISRGAGRCPRTRSGSAWPARGTGRAAGASCRRSSPGAPAWPRAAPTRSEEHTSELQSRQYLVCRLLLEQKKHKYCITRDDYII